MFLVREPRRRRRAVPGDRARAPWSRGRGRDAHEIARGRGDARPRRRRCNLVVDEAAVSKVHARIERTRDQLVLEDLGSANGTFVNGTRAHGGVPEGRRRCPLGGVETYGS